MTIETAFYADTAQEVTFDLIAKKTTASLQVDGLDLQAALEAASAHAVSRTQFGKQLASFQLVQQLIADIAVQTNAARQVYQSAARLLDAGADARVECSMSKYFCSEAANQVATRAVQVFGAAGLMEGNVAERLFRDAREATIPEGTSQMQILQIGKALLGVSAVR